MSPKPFFIAALLLCPALLACTHTPSDEQGKGPLVTSTPVSRADGSLALDQFAVCDVKPPQAPESERSVQLLLHSEAPAGTLEPDEFAQLTEEVWRRSIAGLLV